MSESVCVSAANNGWKKIIFKLNVNRFCSYSNFAWKPNLVARGKKVGVVWRLRLFILVDRNRCRFHCYLLSFRSFARSSPPLATYTVYSVNISVELAELYKRFMCFTKMECYLFHVVQHRKHLHFMSISTFFSVFSIYSELIVLHCCASHGSIFK